MNTESITQDNLIECLDKSRKKLKFIFAEIKKDPKQFQEAMAHVQGGGVGGNQYKLFREGPQGSWVHGPPGRHTKKNGR